MLVQFPRQNPLSLCVFARLGNKKSGPKVSVATNSKKKQAVHINSYRTTQVEHEDDDSEREERREMPRHHESDDAKRRHARARADDDDEEDDDDQDR